MATSFPVNPEVLGQYPNLAGYFKSDAENGRSDKQIFRLLDNLHYPHIERLVNFLEEMASDERYQRFIYQKLNTSDLIQFRTGLHEIYLLRFLLKNGYSVKPFDDRKGSKSVPEFHAVREDRSLLCELYSPIELYGYQIFYEELRLGIKCLDAPFGFRVDISLVNNYPFGDPSRYYFPYRIRELYADGKHRKSKVEEILHKIKEKCKDESGEVLCEISDHLQLRVEVEKKKDTEDRLVVIGQGTHS